MKRFLPLTMILIILSVSAAYGVEPTKDQSEVIVKNAEGESIGTVSNALTDRAGNIAFIIVSLGKKGQQNKEIAVPLEAFSVDRESKTLTLNASKEQVAAAPEFNPSDLNDPSFAEKSYRAFGQAPPWTEAPEGSKGMRTKE